MSFKILTFFLIFVLAAGIFADNSEYLRIVREAKARRCLATMHSIQSAAEMYEMEYNKMPKLAELTDYLQGGKIPKCSESGKYSILKKGNSIYIKCSVHNTIEELKINEPVYVVERPKNPREDQTQTAGISEILGKQRTVLKDRSKEVSEILRNRNVSDMLVTKGSSRGNTYTRIKALLDRLGEDAQVIVRGNRSIEAMLFKNWVFHAEFEKDMATLLPIFREANEAYGNLANSVNDLKAEIFNPSQFCFAELEASLDVSGTAFGEAYGYLRQGKNKIGDTRKKYTTSRSEYSKTFQLIDKLIDQFEDVIQPSPVPVPAPVPMPSLSVDVRRMHINPGKYDIVNESTQLGQEIMREVRDYMKDEMSTLDRIQLKFALSGANGFNYAIVKISNNRYCLYWWHVLDEIMDILPID